MRLINVGQVKKGGGVPNNFSELRLTQKKISEFLVNLERDESLSKGTTIKGGTPVKKKIRKEGKREGSKEERMKERNKERKKKERNKINKKRETARRLF